MAPPRIAPGRVLLDIVEQHAEEAAFLWLLRDKAVDAPHYKRHHLARLEERIEAHLDGLRVAGAVGYEVALRQLERHAEKGELFAAATLALETGETARLEPLVEMARVTPEIRRGLYGAIGWIGVRGLRPWTRDWLWSEDAFERLLGIVACSLHRVNMGVRLDELLDDSDADVRARAHRLAGEIGRQDLCAKLAETGASDVEPAHAWAVWAAGLLGHQAAFVELEPIAEQGGAAAEPALELLVRGGEPGQVTSWIRSHSADLRRSRLVIKAVGGLGDAAALPWLLARMTEPEVACLAGEAFSLITGVDIALADLEAVHAAAKPAAAESPFPDVADEGLPRPSALHVAAWLHGNGAAFVAGRHYLLGHAKSPSASEHAWAHGYQRQRRAAAYELACHHGAATLRTWRQRVGRIRESD